MIFKLQEPSVPKVPVLISVPHGGIEFPQEIKAAYKPALISAPEDTDWFVDRLYDFALSMGVTLISARYSRWVIDLNRTPGSQALYNDGRMITPLVPPASFLGESLYVGEEPSEEEIQRRTRLYYAPYHQKIKEILQDFRQKFGIALLYEAHSIKQRVPSICAEPFPDLILGDNDETSAHPRLIQAALEGLSSGRYQLTHNTPFKGGYITRHFGNPQENIHALQLERTKVLYMNEAETVYDATRAQALQKVLKYTLKKLIDTLEIL